MNEVDVVDVALGQTAEVEVDALGSEPQAGNVVEIATSGRKDAALGTIKFLVKVALDDPDPNLRPAMTAKVDILTATREDTLTVPIQAVVKRALEDDGGELKGTEAKGLDKVDVVYLIEDDGAILRVVTTGVADDLFVEITEGLDDGDDVVVGPYRTLKNLHAGDRVWVAEADEDEADDTAEDDVEVRIG